MVISNAPPTASNVTIASDSAASGDADPNTAIHGDTLSCSYGFVDNDGHGDQSGHEWLINGISVQSGGDLTGNFYYNDTIVCEVVPYDGYDYGDPASSQLIIGNSPPTAPASANIAETAPEIGEVLTCDYQAATDADIAQTLTYSIAWYEASAGLTVYTSKELPSSVTQYESNGNAASSRVMASRSALRRARAGSIFWTRSPPLPQPSMPSSPTVTSPT